MIWLYDIEVYLNYFAVIFKNPKSQELKEFIIFEDRNDLDKLKEFISDKHKWFVGYNSFYFDNQLLNYIYIKYQELTLLSTKEITSNIYYLAKLIIESDYNTYKYNLPFRSLDLMKIGGIMKSLKLVAVSLKWSLIQDLPLSWDTIITKDHLELMHKYNLNDVLITEQLYYKLKEEIKLRFDISKLYKVDAYSESRSGMANRLLEKFYADATGLSLYDFKKQRTKRPFIKLDWVVFDEIQFNTNTLVNLLEEIKTHVYFANKPFYKRVITYNNVKYKLGFGGIHSQDKPGLFEEDNEYYIIDADVGAQYPSLMINKQLKPAHLDKKFIKDFANIKTKRMIAKKENHEVISKALKIVLVSTVGKTLNENNWLYDPLVNLQVTINCQLYMLMLIEQLTLHDFQVISANTDGIVTKVQKNRAKEYVEICHRWEKLSSFELEFTSYKKYIRRDVNNYLVIKQDGSIKTKGIFSTKTELTKGYDKPIVSIALYEYFINNKPIKQTILEHTDIYDFCIAKKIDDKFTNIYRKILEGVYKEDTLQKSVRYYVSNINGSLFKVNKTTHESSWYEQNRNVTIFNEYIHHDDVKDYNIDYSYYINTTQKIIDKIIDPQLKLKLF